MVGGAYMAGKGRVRGQVRDQEQEERLAALEAEQAHSAPPMAPAAPAPAAPVSGAADIASKLTQLKSLLDQGVLTPEEFESAKQKVLAG